MKRNEKTNAGLEEQVKAAAKRVGLVDLSRTTREIISGGDSDYKWLDQHYPGFVVFGQKFVEEMENSDHQFDEPSNNFLAVEHAIMGFIYGQPWFPEMQRRIWLKHSREQIILMVAHLALQVAHDVTGGKKMFKRTKAKPKEQRADEEAQLHELAERLGYRLEKYIDNPMAEGFPEPMTICPRCGDPVEEKECDERGHVFCRCGTEMVIRRGVIAAAV